MSVTHDLKIDAMISHKQKVKLCYTLKSLYVRNPLVFYLLAVQMKVIDTSLKDAKHKEKKRHHLEAKKEGTKMLV